jgi:hypothetical protein
MCQKGYQVNNNLYNLSETLSVFEFFSVFEFSHIEFNEKNCYKHLDIHFISCKFNFIIKIEYQMES